jgi:hypothetical protein
MIIKVGDYVRWGYTGKAQFYFKVVKIKALDLVCIKGETLDIGRAVKTCQLEVALLNLELS